MTRVLIDCDGVLSAFTEGWLKLINAARRTSFTPADVTSWDICASIGIPEDERGAAKRLLAECPRFAARLDVLPGAVDGVRRLQELAEVYVVTSPWNSHPTWTHDREDWLRQHFNLPHSRVIHTSAKHVCVGDVFVDGKTSMCVTWAEAHPSGVAVQFQTPHNRRDTWAGLSTGSWDELIKIVSARADDARSEQERIKRVVQEVCAKYLSDEGIYGYDNRIATEAAERLTK